MKIKSITVAKSSGETTVTALSRSIKISSTQIVPSTRAVSRRELNMVLSVQSALTKVGNSELTTNKSKHPRTRKRTVPKTKQNKCSA